VRAQRRTLVLTVLLAWFLSVSTPAFAVDPEELLDPAQAFQFSAHAVDAQTVRATWKVADGYYLYRDKIRITSATPAIALGLAEPPPGETKRDEFFGEIAILRGDVAVEVPIKTRAADVEALEIRARFQGCADVGVCYPPQDQVAVVALPMQPAGEPSAAGAPLEALQALSKIGAGLGAGAEIENDFLPPDEAFVLSATTRDRTSITARWDIAPGYYLYRDKIQLALEGASGITLGAFTLPPGDPKDDEFLGRIQVYHDRLEVDLPLVSGSGPIPGFLDLKAGYQGCAERGLCYPPIEKLITVAVPSAAAAPPQTGADPSAEPPHAFRSEQDRIADTMREGATWLTVLSFFGFGLLLTFTPCVFPMIPILSSIIVGQGSAITGRRAFFLSLVYVLAMAVAYTAAGMIAGLGGQNLQAAFQNPWVLITFAGIFVALSLSMFGFYELQVPASLQSHLSALSNRQHGGTVVGVAVMGLLSALIVGPCVAAPLAGALIYIGQSGDAMLGGLALFALSMGMGTPLLAIGTSAGKLLPRAGAWMDSVKAVFGVLLLAVAVWMLERILPGEVTLVLWALLLIIPAVYMGALEPLRAQANGWSKLWKGVGLAMLVYGSLLIIGAASGSKDALQPLALVATSVGGEGRANAGHPAFERIRSGADLDRKLAQAHAAQRPVMLDFYADWCTSCQEMEKYTFSDPGVQETLAGLVLLQADVTANDATDRELLQRFGLFGPPSILFFGPDGEERRDYRLVGFLDAGDFRTHVERAVR
jgi:thiol:disulfide interchange protein DsbD